MKHPSAVLLLLLCCLAVPLFAATPPHIVITLADDLGYGDLSCYRFGRWKFIETKNFAAEHPEIVPQFSSQLAQARDEGRTRR